MILQYVHPRFTRWDDELESAQYFSEKARKIVDTYIGLFVEATPLEAVAIADRFGLPRPDDEDRYEARELMHRTDGVQRLTFVVMNDLSNAEYEDGHHPYHQLYNSNSPWWAMKQPLEFSFIDELSAFTMPDPADMDPLGGVGEHSWPNGYFTIDDFRAK